MQGPRKSPQMSLNSPRVIFWRTHLGLVLVWICGLLLILFPPMPILFEDFNYTNSSEHNWRYEELKTYMNTRSFDDMPTNTKAFEIIVAIFWGLLAINLCWNWKTVLPRQDDVWKWTCTKCGMHALVILAALFDLVCSIALTVTFESKEDTDGYEASFLFFEGLPTTFRTATFFFTFVALEKSIFCKEFPTDQYSSLSTKDVGFSSRFNNVKYDM